MKTVFADTFFYIALLSESDGAHRPALEFARRTEVRIVTSEWVLVKLADGFAAGPGRARAAKLIIGLRNDPAIRIFKADQRTLDLAIELYADRPDKTWSLTDCTSFITMRKRRITEALTADRHFAQAGFKALLR